jgi:hypothetical protein
LGIHTTRIGFKAFFAIHQLGVLEDIHFSESQFLWKFP